MATSSGHTAAIGQSGGLCVGWRQHRRRLHTYDRCFMLLKPQVICSRRCQHRWLWASGVIARRLWAQGRRVWCCAAWSHGGHTLEQGGLFALRTTARLAAPARIDGASCYRRSAKLSRIKHYSHQGRHAALGLCTRISQRLNKQMISAICAFSEIVRLCLGRSGVGVCPLRPLPAHVRVALSPLARRVLELRAALLDFARRVHVARQQRRAEGRCSCRRARRTLTHRRLARRIMVNGLQALLEPLGLRRFRGSLTRARARPSALALRLGRLARLSAALVAARLARRRSGRAGTGWIGQRPILLRLD